MNYHVSKYTEIIKDLRSEIQELKARSLSFLSNDDTMQSVSLYPFFIPFSYSWHFRKSLHIQQFPLLQHTSFLYVFCCMFGFLRVLNVWLFPIVERSAGTWHLCAFLISPFFTDLPGTL